VTGGAQKLQPSVHAGVVARNAGLNPLASLVRHCPVLQCLVLHFQRPRGQYVM